MTGIPFADLARFSPPQLWRFPSEQFSFQELPNQASNWSATLLEWLGIPNILLEQVPDTPPEYYSCQFKASKLQWYDREAPCTQQDSLLWSQPQ